MIYGKEKVRTMQRSILPSAGRKCARDDKRALVKKNRRPIKVALNSYYGDWDDHEGNLTYWEGPNRHDFGEIISRRRGNDKLAHFEMWAYQKTKHLRVEDRYSKMAGILPNGVIGNHALSHLDFLQPIERQGFIWRRPLVEDEYWNLPRRLRESYWKVFTTKQVATVPVPDVGDVAVVKIIRR